MNTVRGILKLVTITPMKIIITINIASFCLAIYWSWHSGFESEPIIVALSLLATLIGISIKKVVPKKIKIKGNKNFTVQRDKRVDTEIEGNDNITFQ